MSKRKDFILNDLNKIISDFELEYNVDVRVQEAIYQNIKLQNIVNEMRFSF